VTVTRDPQQTAVRSAVYRGGPSDPLDPAETFHEASKIFRGTHSLPIRPIWWSEEDLGQVRDSGKEYPHTERLALPGPRELTMSLGRTLGSRRSGRMYSTSPLALDDLSTLMLGIYGRQDVTTSAARTCPSAGGLYPLELYVLAMNLENVPAGVFHYLSRDHSLERLDGLDHCSLQTALGEVNEPMLDASVCVIVCAAFWRNKLKYGSRGYRFALLEAGHAAQNFLLTATALNLNAVPVGGFADEVVAEVIAVDCLHEAPLYLLFAGPVP
jgi:SagB-type dehydrogenase family enzyme